MILAVASGKGGAGKTTLSAALAEAAERPVCFLDCDVEEPNARFLLHPNLDPPEPVCESVPVIDPDRCTGCGACADFCQFNALVSLGGPPLVFPDLCHSCGGCARVCPEDAIAEEPHQIGETATGRTSAGAFFAQGTMLVGRAMAPPVVRATRRLTVPERLCIIDAPPGAACPMTAAVRCADFVLLVAEPTPFGLNDLRIALETVRRMSLPCGVVLNRSGAGDAGVRAHCAQKGVDILLELPEDRSIAEAYSRGEGLLEARPDLRPRLQELLRTLADRTRETPPCRN